MSAVQTGLSALGSVYNKQNACIPAGTRLPVGSPLTKEMYGAVPRWGTPVPLADGKLQTALLMQGALGMQSSLGATATVSFPKPGPGALATNVLASGPGYGRFAFTGPSLATALPAAPAVTMSGESASSASSSMSARRFSWLA